MFRGGKKPNNHISVVLAFYADLNLFELEGS